MNKFVYALLSIAVVVLFFVFFIHKKEPLPPPKNLTVVAFGDSLIAGYGSTKGNDFISILGRETGVNIINEGVNGDTTDSALARIDTVLAHDPGVVILLLGGNDYLRRVPKEVTFENLGRIVLKFKENNTRVVLLGVLGGLLRDNYEKDFKNFAKSNDLIYVENVLDGIIGDQQLMSDQVHPNDTGYKKIAEKVLPALREAL